EEGLAAHLDSDRAAAHRHRPQHAHHSRSAQAEREEVRVQRRDHALVFGHPLRADSLVELTFGEGFEELLRLLWAHACSGRTRGRGILCRRWARGDATDCFSKRCARRTPRRPVGRIPAWACPSCPARATLKTRGCIT